MADSATRGALPGSHCKQAVAAVAAAEGLKVLKGHAVARRGTKHVSRGNAKGRFRGLTKEQTKTS